MIVYTDGSHIPGQDGCGYAGVGIWFGHNDIRNTSIQVTVSNPTNQVAELLAIDNALRICKGSRELVIRSDSQYSIKSITEWSIKWKQNGWKNSKGEDVANSDIIKSILEKISQRDAQGYKISFEHVYGHKGEVGNEGADKLAVAASLKVEKHAMDNTIYFYSHVYGDYRSFSQFYPCKIIMTYDGKEIEYNSSEQHHHHQRALLFKDYEKASAIMQSDSPGEQKRLGRLVKDIDKDIWLSQCYDICKRCNIAKFSQHDKMRSLLMSTKGKRLAEASHDNCIWGIGISAPDSKAKRKWRGQNLLGKVLMDIRDNVFDE